MKLKQRLLLAPILIFLYLITKPHWADDESPWTHRSRYVGKVVRRDPSDHPYQGAFVSVPNPAPAAQQQQQQQQQQPVAPAAPVKPVQPIQPVIAAAPRPYPVDKKPVVVAPAQPVIAIAPKAPPPAPQKPVQVPAAFDPPRKPPSPPRQQIQLTDDKPLMPKPKTSISKAAPKQPPKKEPTVKPVKKQLPGGGTLKFSTMKPAVRTHFVEEEIKNIALDLSMQSKNDPWQTAKDWIRSRSIYPQKHKSLGAILKSLTTSKVMKADILTKGTQLKMLWFLQGNQKVIFKPKRYEREHVVKGKAYDGYDRHNGEIAAFHLDRILNFRRAPLVVGRRVNLKNEVLPVATSRLSETFKERNHNTCFYGQCYYCKETELACGKGEIMEGAVTLWMPDSWTLEKVRHPYQRTYRDDKQARWETDDDYCNAYVKKSPPYDKGPRLLDLMDTAIFDFIIGNADRHHYEVFAEQPDSMVLLLDNAKSFGNPEHDELSILAPITQCCLLRKSTFDRLTELKGGLLTKMLIEATKTDPIAPILHKKHIEAINRRMPMIFAALQKCVSQNGLDNVLVENWSGPPKGE